MDRYLGQHTERTYWRQRGVRLGRWFVPLGRKRKVKTERVTA